MSSKRRLRRRQCGHKLRRSEAGAREQAAELSAKDGARMGWYRCPWCHDWHCGRMPMRSAKVVR